MRVVVLGATGNVGTSVVRALASDPDVESVVGVARRPGGLDLDGLEWARADIARPTSHRSSPAPTPSSTSRG